MSNERGGIISNIFIIPVGVILMVGFFFLGFYVGKYQNRSVASEEFAPPLPDIAPSADQKQEEFTFYKTLTDKNDKTVSIDLKPRPVTDESKSARQQPAADDQRAIPAPSAPKEKRIAIDLGKEAVSPEKAPQVLPKRPQPPERRETAASASAKLRYTIQTASYKERAMAEDEVKRLKKRGFAAFIVSSELPGKGVWHRVRIGSFSNRVAAEKLQRTIHEKERILTIVVSE